MKMRQRGGLIIKDDGKKRIIVQKLKHGSEYYDATTQEDANASLLKMFKNNKDNSCYLDVLGSDIEKEFKTKKQELDELENAAKPLPSGLSAVYYKTMEATAQKFLAKKREFDTFLAEADLAARADSGDVVAVYEFLCSRRDGEYEDFSVVILK